MTKNAGIKAYAKANGVKLYEVAEALGIRPTEFSVQYMRNTMAAETEKRVRMIIRAIAQEKKNKG